jgi:hypothetical protein
LKKYIRERWAPIETEDVYASKQRTSKSIILNLTSKTSMDTKTKKEHRHGDHEQIVVLDIYLSA